ncbi:hypothetical protein KC348_g70 [Hortaea werneckii]|nr:hypothetical protein KC348_g70 [Hortaea werneckii]
MIKISRFKTPPSYLIHSLAGRACAYILLSDTATALVEERLPSGPLVVRFSCSSLSLGRRSSRLVRTRERSFDEAKALPQLRSTGNRSRSKDHTTGNIVTAVKNVSAIALRKHGEMGDLPTMLTVTSRMYQAKYS